MARLQSYESAMQYFKKTERNYRNKYSDNICNRLLTTQDPSDSRFHY